MHHDSETLARGKHFLKATLMPRYPGFRSPNPLKIGILEDIRKLHPNVSVKVAMAALHIHCSAFKYLLILKKATVRVDLSGEAAGQVDPAHAKRASIKLRALDEKRRKGIAVHSSAGKLPAADEGRSRNEPLTKAVMASAQRGTDQLQLQLCEAAPARVRPSQKLGPNGKPILRLKKGTPAIG